MRTLFPGSVAFVAWLLFMVSLVLPAVEPNLGAWNQPDAKPFPGWVAAWIGWYFWPTNVVLFLCPVLSSLVLRIRTKSLRFWLRLSLGTLLTGSIVGAVALTLSDMFDSVHSGHWCWLGSQVLAATLFVVPHQRFREAPARDQES